MFKKNGFKLFICAMVAAFFLALPFVVTSLNGAEKNESEYKSAISEHMQREHGVSIASYQSFDSGSGAFAKVIVRAGLEGSGSIDLSAEITVDKNYNISSCSLCDLGI